MRVTCADCPHVCLGLSQSLPSTDIGLSVGGCGSSSCLQPRLRTSASQCCCCCCRADAHTTAHTHARTGTHAGARTRACKHTYRHTYTRTDTDTHTHTHIHTHTHTHKHTHTHTHTHTQTQIHRHTHDVKRHVYVSRITDCMSCMHSMTKMDLFLHMRLIYMRNCIRQFLYMQSQHISHTEVMQKDASHTDI